MSVELLTCTSSTRLFRSWRFLNITNKASSVHLSLSRDNLCRVLWGPDRPADYDAFGPSIGPTLVMGRNYGPQINVKRLDQGQTTTDHFRAFLIKLNHYQETSSDYLPGRGRYVCMVKVPTCWWGFDETLTEMCEERTGKSDSADSIPTISTGASQDRFV